MTLILNSGLTQKNYLRWDCLNIYLNYITIFNWKNILKLGKTASKKIKEINFLTFLASWYILLLKNPVKIVLKINL